MWNNSTLFNYVLNSILKYSPLRAVRRVLILLSSWFSYFILFDLVKVFTLIPHRHSQSSYSEGNKVPITSSCNLTYWTSYIENVSISIHHFASSPFYLNGDLVIIPVKQDSHVPIAVSPNESSRFVCYNFFMHFSFIWPRRWCHKRVSTDWDNLSLLLFMFN